MRVLPLLATCALLPLAIAGCTKSGNIDIAANDGGTGGTQPTPDTNTCPGSDTRCLHGTVTTKGFTARFLFARAFVYSVYPNGDARPVGFGSPAGSDGGNEVAKDGTFAVGNLDPLDHYYVRVLARFNAGDPTKTIETIVGPLSIPSAGAIDVKIRPVTLEVLQGRVAGGRGETTVTWASARVYNPATGNEVNDATVTFHAGAETFSLPYTTNSGGKQTYFALAGKGVAGNTTFTFDVAHPSFASATWTLTGAPATFDGVVSQPADGAAQALGTDLTVTWPAQPLATYEIVQLFLSQSGTYLAKYQSPAPVSPETTSVVIPGSSIDVAGKYLLNVQYANTTCPASADGCVYNTSTAVANINVQ